jgi:CDP-paratose 2-epimerase
VRVLVTGGCGFIGTNLGLALAARGDDVVALDDLSRRGSERNRETLASAERVTIVEGDVRNADVVAEAVADCDAVIHLAGQVAVTTSILEPRHDFEVNALGTINVLEACRQSNRRPTVLFASTNKVYGGMEEVGIVEKEDRYDYAALPHGVPESFPLDFHSPYGCSKGAADQYVRDYSRIYGLPAAVFRMSCIYGPHQSGNEDQGWVAHFAISALRGDRLTIYGDGKQVRDVLHVDDLVAVYLQALDHPELLGALVVNVGGGARNTLTLRALIETLEALVGRPIEYTFGDWRAGDQRIYVSDIRKAERELGWTPQIDVEAGVRALVEWLDGQPWLRSERLVA